MRVPSPVLLLAVATLWLLSGCQTLHRAEPPEPTLELLHAASLAIPEGCEASSSVVVAFTVATTGRAIDIESPADAPACVQDALIAWVESFRYAPPAQVMPTAIEWLMVSAKRGS